MSSADSEELTCGRGVAANAELPQHLADLVAAMAAVLEHHMTALPVSDADARAELEGYAAVVARARDAETALEELAQEMRAKRDLPAAPHDMSILMAPAAQAVFASLVEKEGTLAAVLERRLKEHAQLVDLDHTA